MTTRLAPLMAALTGLIFSNSAYADDFVSPDILVLGDSQISFGAGPAYLDFFEDLAASCNVTGSQAMKLDKLGEPRIGVIGVRSSSLPNWISTSSRGKSPICDVDPKWRVNAGTYGDINTTGNKYVQIGRGQNYQFCTAGESPFQTMFQEDYYTPSLTLITFLGNSARRWADSLDAAITDVERMNEQLPEGMGCIFMTTQPAYKQSIIDRRYEAQENLELAFEVTDSQCTFIPGMTEETIEANLGNRSHFRQRNNGSVKDPFHPNERAARLFLEIQRDTICTAIFDQLERLPDIPMETALAE